MTTRTRVTKRQAEKVLAAVKRQWKPFLKAGYTPPTLIMDWDWTGYGPRPSIVWEEGPFEWAITSTLGGKDQEFFTPIEELDYDRDEVFVEPITSWSLGIYPS